MIFVVEELLFAVAAAVVVAFALAGFVVIVLYVVGDDDGDVSDCVVEMQLVTRILSCNLPRDHQPKNRGFVANKITIMQQNSSMN